MTDSQYLFIVLVVVYLAECVSWIHAQAIALRWYSEGRGSGTLAPDHFGNPDGGVVFKPVVATLGYFLVVRPLPISLSPQGVFSYVSDAPGRELRCKQRQRFLSWDEVRDVRRLGKAVMIAGEAFATADSSYQAQRLCGVLKRLTDRKPDQREDTILKVVRSTMDAVEMEKRITDFEQEIGGLRFCCSLLFLVLFLVGPLSTMRFGIEQVWLPIGLFILALHVAVAWLFARRFRALYPQSNDEKWVHIVSMVLNPAAASRAIDRLSRDLFCEFDPVAAAQVLLSPKRFRPLARALLVDLKHPFQPICPGAAPAALATESWWREVRLRHVEEFLSRSGVSPEELLAADTAGDTSAVCYCPRCERHFETDVKACDPCGGIPTQKWPAGGAFDQVG